MIAEPRRSPGRPSVTGREQWADMHRRRQSAGTGRDLRWMLWLTLVSGGALVWAWLAWWLR